MENINFRRRWPNSPSSWCPTYSRGAPCCQ